MLWQALDEHYLCFLVKRSDLPFQKYKTYN